MILERIRQAYPRLTKSQKLLADLIATSYQEVAFMNASTLARRLSLNEATVIRFAQRLGYPGFPEMIKDVQGLVYRELVADAPPDVAAQEEDPFLAALHATTEGTQRALGHVAPEVAAQALNLLQGAGLVVVAGEGLAGGLASYLALHLRGLGRPAVAVEAGAMDLSLWLDQLQPGTLMVGISLSPIEGHSVPNALRQADRQGAGTLALAASPLSPCAQSAALALTCLTAGETQGSPCLSAVAALIETLATALAARRPQEGSPLAQALQRARELIQSPKRPSS
jgi:DNA-binding MurR/RpiR family transcriptional regulator